MSSSYAATMRRREERRLLRLYHGAGNAGAREELADHPTDRVVHKGGI